MDWAKAKTILIVAFLLLNIFLLTTLLLTNTNLRFQSDYVRYARNYLESRDIHIETDIPDFAGQIGVISYAVKDYNLEEICMMVFGRLVSQSEIDNITTLSEGEEKICLSEDQLYIRDRIQYEEDLFNDPNCFQDMVLSYLECLGWNKKNISLQTSEIIKQEIEQVYLVKYKNALLFDKEIKVMLDKEGIFTAILPAKEVNNTNNPKDILSAYQVLVMGGLPGGARIRSVDLGYKQIEETDLYDSPVWRVILDDGSVFFFNAYRGEELK